MSLLCNPLRLAFYRYILITLDIFTTYIFSEFSLEHSSKLLIVVYSNSQMNVFSSTCGFQPEWRTFVGKYMNGAARKVARAAISNSRFLDGLTKTHSSPNLHTEVCARFAY